MRVGNDCALLLHIRSHVRSHIRSHIHSHIVDVVVDKKCGEAVVRGAHVFAPGVLAVNKGGALL